MTVTVQNVMRQMRNYFIASTLTGTFTVADGIIDLDPPLAPGAWVAIEGSGSFDGVHQLDENGKLPDAADGSWRGLLHLLSPTADFLRLCRDIRDWADKHPDETLRRRNSARTAAARVPVHGRRSLSAACAPICGCSRR